MLVAGGAKLISFKDIQSTFNAGAKTNQEFFDEQPLASQKLKASPA
jgi:hypothetical protein